MSDSELFYEHGIDLFPVDVEVEFHCPNCGSANVVIEAVQYETGVRSAGYSETCGAEVLRCRECGCREEI